LNEVALVPFEALQKMASVLGKNKLFGMGQEDLLPLMLIAQAEGKHPASAAQEYDIIQGKPALRSRAALARFQAAGGSIAWGERTPEKAVATLSHPQGGSLTVTWTMERAKRAGLTGKDNWQKYPEAMLSARVIAEGVRAVFPGCLSGMYLGEEVQDFDGYTPPPERNVTPAREEEAAPAVELKLTGEGPSVLDLRAKLGKLSVDPMLIEDGKAKIASMLAKPDATSEELAELVERTERFLEKVKGKKEGK
jgi:hypothetical protein